MKPVGAEANSMPQSGLTGQHHTRRPDAAPRFAGSHQVSAMNLDLTALTGDVFVDRGSIINVSFTTNLAAPPHALTQP